MLTTTDGTNSTATQSVTVTIAGAGNDAFVFHPGVGSDTVVRATAADTIELDGFSSVTSNKQLASLLADAQAGEPQSLFQTAHGGHDTLINLANHDVITLTNVPLSALHASDFIVHRLALDGRIRRIDSSMSINLNRAAISRRYKYHMAP